MVGHEDSPPSAATPSVLLRLGAGQGVEPHLQVGLVGGGGGGSDLKLRDKHLIRRVDVLDREDTDDLKFTYELVPRDQVLMLLFLLQEGRRKLSCLGTICPFFDIGLIARHSKLENEFFRHIKSKR